MIFTVIYQVYSTIIFSTGKPWNNYNILTFTHVSSIICTVYFYKYIPINIFWQWNINICSQITVRCCSYIKIIWINIIYLKWGRNISCIIYRTLSIYSSNIIYAPFKAAYNKFSYSTICIFKVICTINW